jgi:AraC family transcriptional regulator
MSYPVGESSLLAIFQTVEYIEAHLREEITVANMAAAAGYSLYHFIRAFDRIVLHTPYNYLMRRRISEAARDLLDTPRRVVDIALDYRFNNHETFSRAFKRCFGLQPVQWRERGFIPYGVLMPTLSLSYIRHIHHPGLQRPQVIEMPARILAGLMTPLKGDPAAIRDLWASLDAFHGLKTAPRLALTSHAENGEMFYLAGREIASLDTLSPFLAAQILPAGKYVCMAHPGPAGDSSFTFDSLLHTWLPKNGLFAAFPIEICTWEDENHIIASLPVSVKSPVQFSV